MPSQQFDRSSALRRVLAALAATLLAMTTFGGVAPSATADEESDEQRTSPCAPLPETLDLAFTFTLSGSTNDVRSHSVVDLQFNQEVRLRGTLHLMGGAWVYNISEPGSTVEVSGSHSSRVDEVYRETDIVGMSTASGSTVDPTSYLRIVLEDDDDECRFLVAYQPNFTDVEGVTEYNDMRGRTTFSGNGGEGSFAVHGVLDDEWTGRASYSGSISDGNTLTDGTNEINGPWGIDASVEVVIGEMPLSPDAELVVEHLDVPSLEDWVEVPATGTYEGNAVRLTAQVGNPSTAATAQVTIRDETSGEIIAGPIHVAVEPGDNEYEWELDTEGLAWDDAGERTEPLELRLIVEMYGTVSTAVQFLPVNPRPVVLVHGWNSAAAGWDGYAEILRARHPLWEVHAAGDGAFDGTMQTGSIADPTDRGLGLVANAGQLGTYVEDLRDKLDAQHVDLVAHSMGGLISRYYVAALMEPANGRPAATRVLMLGTPNLGSPCATIIPHASAYDLDPEVIAQFNSVVTATHGVQFAILAGDSWPTTCHVPGEGDMVVQVESAFALPYVTDRQRTSTDHVSMTSSVDDAERYVLPRLTRPVAQGAGAASGVRTRRASLTRPSQTTDTTAAAEPATEPPTEGDAAPPISLASGVVELDRRESVDVPVTVDALDAIAAVITAAPDVTASLIPPAPAEGREPDAAATATTDPAVIVAATDQVAAPAPGTWTLRLESQSSEVASVAYAVVGSGDTAPRLSVEVDGDSLVIVVDGAATPPIVEASLVDAKGRSTSLAVAADGEGRPAVDLPSAASGSTLVVTAQGDGWTRTVREHVVDPEEFAVPERTFPDPIQLTTPPDAVEPMEHDATGDDPEAAATADAAEGDGGLPVALLAVVGAAVIAGAAAVVVRRRATATRPNAEARS